MWPIPNPALHPQTHCKMSSASEPNTTDEVRNLVEVAKQLVLDRGDKISMAQVIDVCRDLVSVCQDVHKDESGDFKKQAVVAAMDEALEGTVLHAAAMSMIPPLIDAVCALPPGAVLANAEAAAAVVDNVLETIGVDADLADKVEDAGALVSDAAEAVDGAVGLVSDAADVVEDVVDNADEIADDVIDVADSVFDAVGVDVDAEEIADALKDGIAHVARRKGCCIII